MRLKRLELFGFKSFADRSVLDFEHSLVGIVGPNGCGKSNVVDAVRWVLGERRPTSMRGSEMTDVIFKGSVSRPALSVAEVTMVIGNECGTLEGHASEVAITRRVFKSGEGEYLIDGERVRLKDLRELLFNTGLGSRGYSVLEQGRIDAVLSADAMERRTIFEEAAGISRYRQRKKEAESRLKRVAQDLARLDDVLGELATRSRSLKIQAGKAERFVQARDCWREQTARLARHQIHADSSALTALAGTLGELEGRAEELKVLRGELERDVSGREHEQEVLSAEVERLTAQASEVAGDLRALDERRSQLTSRVGAWKESAADESRRGEELQGKLAQRSAELEAFEREAAELERAVEEAELRMGEEARGLRELLGGYRASRQACQEQNEQVLACLHERTASQNRVQHLEQALGPHAERAQRATERSAEATRNLEAAHEAEAAARHGLNEAEARQDDAQARVEVGLSLLAELDEELRELEQRRVERDKERTRLGSRIESLLDYQQEREGLGDGARALLADQSEGPRAALLGGLLADHLRTETRCARALDAVLGERARALVVEDTGRAAEVVRWLKQSREGQVRLVTPAGFGSRQPTPLSVLDPALAAAVEGPLRARVVCDPQYAPLADQLLADVWLVRDVDAALELVAANPRLRAVTPDGDLVDAGGLYGGWREVAHGPMGRRATAAELEVREGELAVELGELVSRIGALRERRVAGKRDLEAGRTELQVARDVLAEARGAEDSAQARLSDLAEAVRLFTHECETLATEREELERELDASREARIRMAAEFDRENARLAELETQRHQLEAEREQLSERENQARVEWTRLREQAGGVAKRISDLGRVISESQAEMERARRLSSEHHQSATSGQGEYEALGEQRIELLEERGRLEERSAETREREREGREAVESLRRRAEAVTREVEGLMDRISAERLEQQRLQLSRAEILRRLEEELSLDEYDLMEGFEPEAELAEPPALDALSEEVAELKRQLEKLGPVNLEAVDELEEVTQRLTFLQTQRADLGESQRTLESTIQRINEESERLFLETFEAVRGNFQACFRRLFGGGRADVQLAEGLPPLEAGIEIIARAPGREMLPIGLLSGGQRTMTALALLFAIFQAKSSPFCVLDEVDAALDDANIGRFLSLLDAFRARTQFIVVTHNKGTMSACDSLYGVTMQIRGVSHKVDVQLSEVDEFVPEVTGNVGAAAESRASVEAAGSVEEPAEADDREIAAALALAAALDGNGQAQAEAESAALTEGDGADSPAQPDGEPVVELTPRAGPRALGAESPQASEPPLESEPAGDEPVREEISSNAPN